ncbi:sensor histidine kinase [Tsukamurella strandjordii]|uniref:sensor histidine kinase n=1 Tax=Tsukamurella TaxID=2060 RepID=UPI001C7DD6C8|nr:histidine kinase [Tsukamurella sp. TY48]
MSVVRPRSALLRSDLSQSALAALLAAFGSVALAAVQQAMGVDMPFQRSPALVLGALAVLLAMVAVSTVRIRYPEESFLGSTLLMAVLAFGTDVAEFAATPIWWFAIVTLATRVRGRRLALLATVGIAATITVGALVPATDGSTGLTVSVVANALVMFGVFLMIGSVIARGRDRADSSVRALRTAQDEYEARLARSIEDERREMARELHDVAAFHLTGMLVQARAADAVYDRDRERARELLAEAIVQGQRSLDGLRQIVEVLRYAEDPLPQPTVCQIATLVDQAAPSFPSIDLDIDVDEADLAEVDSGTHLTAYRIVQESLANALRHAPGCAVGVRVWIDDQVQIRVRNSIPKRKGLERKGFGLAGMRERASLVGGTVSAGIDHRGDWLVRASLPRCGRPPVTIAADGTENVA